jgi:hypothetical protein
VASCSVFGPKVNYKLVSLCFSWFPLIFSA